MLKHYLKIGFRSFVKYKTTSLINALGLSLAVGCGIFVFVFINFFVTIDRYHDNAENIYVINRSVLIDEGTDLYSGTPDPLLPILKANSAVVTEASRLNDIFGYVRYGDKVFEENIRFVDPGFLKMFSFPLKWGVSASLTNPSSIILSERMSEKYFGSENPIGEELSIKFIVDDVERIESFTISGVADTFVKGSSFAFNFLINYDRQKALGIQLEDWATVNRVSFVQTVPGIEISAVQELANNNVVIHNSAIDELKIADYQFTPFPRCLSHWSKSQT